MHKQVIGIAVMITAGFALTSCGTPSGPASDAGGALKGRGPITFVTVADPGGGTQKLVDAWNAAHPKEKVSLQEQSANSDEAHSALAQNFQAQSDRVDVARINNVWTPEFAARGWIAKLPDGLVDTGEVLAGPLATGIYDSEQYSMPWFTDVGMLYYRTDLVKQAPTTWDELKADCAIAEQNNMDCYAGQFAKYDGLTVNVSEAITSAGGSVLNADGTKATVETAEAKAGLKFLVDGFSDGVIPDKAITYSEEESRQAFQNGKLLFLRNWPYVYNLANTPGAGNQVVGKVGMAPIPGASGPGAPALGGWNLAVSSYSAHQETAADFIAFLEAPEQQRTLLTELGLSPVLASLYEDKALLEKYPYLTGVRANLETSVPLPKSTNWSGLSLAVQNVVYPALQSGASVDELAADLQKAINGALAD